MNNNLQLENIKAPEELKNKTINLMEKARKNRMSLRFMTIRVVVVVALITTLFSVTAFAISRFSSLNGDELKLSSSYDGNGIVSVSIENMSNKPLKFQQEIKLMKWNDAEEIIPIDKMKLTMQAPVIEPNSTGKIVIDLSNAYDVAQLEIPLANDSYYLILTNNNFFHGQDWQCTVKFAETIIEPTPEPILPEIDNTKIQQTEEDLQFYFKDPEYSIAAQEKYIKAYKRLIADFDGNIIPTSYPKDLIITTEYQKDKPIFDDSVAADQQEIECFGVFAGASTTDFTLSKSKLIAGFDDVFMQVMAFLPSATYKNSSIGLPISYLATYEKENFKPNDNYAFIMGQIIGFDKLESQKVYEDNRYLCYDITSYVYTNLSKHINEFVKSTPEAIYNQQLDLRIRNVYDYFCGNWGKYIYQRKNIE